MSWRTFLSAEAVDRELRRKKHSVELQSIRGLAALTVFIHHCTFYYDYDLRWRYIWEVVFNAHAGVMAFFVLSGFVLTLSLSSLRHQFSGRMVIGYYLRRAFRIYPALWCAVLLVLMYVLMFRGVPRPVGVSDWWHDTYRHPLPPTMIVQTLVGLRTTWPVPIWTLAIELAGSLLIPFIALLLFRWPRHFVLVAMAGTLLGPLFDTRIYNIPNYLISFFAGAAIVLVTPTFRRRLNTRAKAITVALVGLLVLWGGRYAIGADLSTDYENSFANMIESLGAMLLIAVVYVRSADFSFLRNRIVAWLGDVSYSFYLIHLVVIGFVAGVGRELLGLRLFISGPVVATLSLLCLALLFSLAVATALHRFVELPMMRGGKVVAQRIVHDPGSAADARLGA